MTIAMFVVGVLVFLVTVYGTIIVGGVMLTSRQLHDQPDLDNRGIAPAGNGLRARARRMIPTEY